MVDELSTVGATKTLTFRPGGAPGKDYFFPFGVPNLGCVIENPADGAIAVTAYMTGCALQVNASGGKYYFYHDAQAKNMATAQPAAPGKIVCRLAPEEYWDTGFANNSMEALKQPFGYHFISVYQDGKWHVGSYRFKISGMTKEITGGGPGLGPKIKQAYVGAFSADAALSL